MKLQRIVMALAAAASMAASHAAPLAPQASTTLEVAFTPGDALPLVLRTIRSAKQSIVVAAYSFTSKPVSLALLEQHRKGVKVAVLVDSGEATKQYSAARFLANQGVPVRINERYAIQHSKFVVIDGHTVQTGSFNYTASAAERNAENVLVVGNTPALAEQYVSEWTRLWTEGKELPPSY